MTRELLGQIAKDKGINLDFYTHIYSWINDKYTKIYINFSVIQVCGGVRNFYCQKTVSLSVAAIMRRQYLGKSDLIPEDYETNGLRWIYEIK